MMARFIGTQIPPTVAAPYISGAVQSGLSDRVTGLIFSDKAGTLYLDQSAFSAAEPFWDYVQSQAVTANTGIGFSFELLAPVYRMRFVPTVDTTVFRLAARQSSAGRN